MMKVYKIKHGDTNVIFLKVNFLGNNQPIDFDGDIIYEEPHLSFGTKEYNFGSSSKFNGCIKHWNLGYRYLDIVKDKNILIKDCKYDVSTFQKLYNLFIGHNVSSAESAKIVKFYNLLLSTKYVNIKPDSNILIFKSNGDTLNVFFKSNFIQIYTNRENTYDNIGIDFSPKDLKLKL